MLKIIENAKTAKSIWDSFDRADEINRYFHLRPTNSGVTIVTTLDGYEMRGRIEKNSEGLIGALNDIADKYKILVSLNDEKRKEAMGKLNFAKRRRRGAAKGFPLEEVVQATMINTMSDDYNLAKALNAQKVEFVASEVILKKGNHRVDIVGFDRTTKILYLFELKKDRTRKVEQVMDYVQHYERKEIREELGNLLKAYTINVVDEIKKIRGVMVMKHAENSGLEKWRKLKEEKNIKILFYRPSLAYINCL